MKLFIEDYKNPVKLIINEVEHKLDYELFLLLDTIENITIDSLELPSLIDFLQEKVDDIVKKYSENSAVKKSYKIKLDTEPNFMKNELKIYVQGSMACIYLKKIKSENWKEVIK